MEILDERSLKLVRGIDLLSRLESLATLYRVDHLRVVETGRELVAWIRETAPPANSVTIAVAGESLAVGSEPLHGERASVESLYKRLCELGLVAIEIGVSVSVADLHALASALRSTSRKLAFANEIVSANFDALPPSIRVHHREFGRRISAAPALVTRAVSDVAHALSSGPLDEAQRATCAQWIERTMRRVADRFETNSDASSSDDELTRALDDAMKVASAALQKALVDHLSSASDHVELRDLFSAIERTVSLSSDADGARALVGVLHDSARETLESASGSLEDSRIHAAFEAPIDERDCMHSLADLRAAIDACLLEASTAEPQDWLAGSRTERLSTLLDLLFEHGDEERLPSVLQALHGMLSQSLVAVEREVVERALREFLTRAVAYRIDNCMPGVDAVFGADRAVLWLGVACDVAESDDPTRLPALWPHLASALLSFPNVMQPALRRRVIGAVARVGRRELGPLVRRLNATSAIFDNRIGAHSFSPLRPELGAFYAALIESTAAETCRPLLLAALRSNRPGWKGSEVLSTIANVDAGSAKLVAAILEHGLTDQPPREVQLDACRYLMTRLIRTEGAQREAPWVESAIRVIGELGFRDAKPVLQRIRGERRKWILPTWPKSARSAARAALDALEAHRA